MHPWVLVVGFVYLVTRILVVRLSMNMSSGLEAFKFAKRKACGVRATWDSISSMSFSLWCPASSSTTAFRSLAFGAGQTKSAERLTRITLAKALYFWEATNQFPP